KVSGPLIDRMDIIIEVPQMDIFETNLLKEGEHSSVVASRVKKARQIQKERYKAESTTNKFKTNADISGKYLAKYTELGDESQKILKSAIEKMKTSMRGYDRILRVARTIADLDEAEKI